MPIARQIYFIELFVLLEIENFGFTLYIVSTVTRSFCFYNSFIDNTVSISNWISNLDFIYFYGRNVCHTVT